MLAILQSTTYLSYTFVKIWQNYLRYMISLWLLKDHKFSALKWQIYYGSEDHKSKTGHVGLKLRCQEAIHLFVTGEILFSSLSDSRGYSIPCLMVPAIFKNSIWITWTSVHNVTSHPLIPASLFPVSFKEPLYID